MYIPHPSLTILSEVRNIISSLPTPCLILGDFNCHHPAWGCYNSSSLGEEIIDIADYYNLCILNTGVPTRRSAPNENPSALDLSICSSSIAHSLLWEVLPLSYGSDHFPIVISFPFKNKPLLKRSPLLAYKLQNADWDKFRKHMDERLGELPNVSRQHLFKSSDAFAKFIINVADEVFPRKKPSKFNIPSPPWWDSECSEAVRSLEES